MRTLRGKRSRFAVALLAVLGLVGGLLAFTSPSASATDVDPTGLIAFELTAGELQVNIGAPNEQYFDLSPSGAAACDDGVDNNDAPPLGSGSDGLIDYFKVEEAIFTGTATGGTGTTIQDATQEWEPGEWIGKSVWITAGPGAQSPPQGRRITNNTATSLTIGGPTGQTNFSPAPGVGSVYNISLADPQCTGPTDNSELVPGLQPVEQVVVVANVAADGSFTIPKNVRASEAAARSLGGIYFPPGYIPDSGFDWITARFQPAPQSNVNTPATGTIDIDTGEVDLTIPVRIKLESTPDPLIGGLGGSCYIPSGNNGITLDFTTGTTNPPGPNEPISGSHYNRHTGQYTVVNNSFSVGGAGSCGFLGAGNGSINAAFGLPSPAGVNAASFSFEANPRLNYLPSGVIADAGPDQFRHLDGGTVTLDGSGSNDPNGDPVLSYEWEQIGGPPVTNLEGTDTAHPTFDGFTEDEEVTFELTVVGERDLYLCPELPELEEEEELPEECEQTEDTDTVTVSFSFNVPPVADAGPDQVVSVGRPVQLDGSASYDPNLDGISYAWVQTGGTATVVLEDDDTAFPTFTSPSVGPDSLVFQLTVTDDFANATDTDTVTIDVIANQSPVANAGDDQLNRKSGQTVNLSAAGSTDPDEHELSFEWTQVSGHAITFNGGANDIVNPSFVIPPAPDFVYPHHIVLQVEVDDGFGGTDTDTVDIEVTASNPTVGTPTRSPSGTVHTGTLITLSPGAINNPDGGSLNFNWVQSSGVPTLLSDNTAQNPTFNVPTQTNGTSACASSTSVTTGCPRYTVQVTNAGTGAASATSSPLAAWASSLPGRPTANAGPPQVVAKGQDPVTLSGSGTQAQGRTLDFQWTQVIVGDEPEVVLEGADTQNPTFVAPDEATVLTFQLITIDPLNPIETGSNQKYSLPSTTTVTVGLGPVANAGPDQVVGAGTLVELDGTGSFDPDGDPIISYLWEQIDGPDVSGSLVGADTATPSFTAPNEPTSVTFRLTVSDGDDIGTDEVTIGVTALDLATVPYLKGEVKAHKDLTKFQVWTTNLFGAPTLVDIHDVEVSITVNGDPVDPGEITILKEVTRNIKQGYTRKFGFIWNHGQNNLRGGDEIIITACVDVEGDDNDANNCGSISRPDGIIDLAADTSRTKDIRVKNLSSKFKVSLWNVGEVAVPVDFQDVDVTVEVNGEPPEIEPVKIAPVDKITLLPKMKMVKPPIFKFDTWRYKALHVGLLWDHGQFEIGDEIKITACSTVPGDVDSTEPAPPLFEPTPANNCSTATRFVVP